MNQSEDKLTQGTQGTQQETPDKNPQNQTQDRCQSQKQTGQSQGISRTGRESSSSGSQVKSAR